MPEPRIVVIENPLFDIEKLSKFFKKNAFSLETYTTFEEYLMKSNCGCHFLFLEAHSAIKASNEMHDILPDRDASNYVYIFTFDEDNDAKLLAEALEKGADDFFQMPLELNLLMIKMRAHQRRIQRLCKNLSQVQGTLKYKNLTLDPISKEVFVKDKRVDLTHSEYMIIYTLAREPHYIYSMEYLFHLITGQKSLGDYNALMTHISRLRKKISTFDPDHQYILTVRNKGYKFNIGYTANSNKCESFL